MVKKILRITLITLPVLAIILLGIFWIFDEPISFYSDDKEEAKIHPKPLYIFGILADSLDICRYTLKQGDNLSLILQKYGISAATVDSLSKTAQGKFDFKNMHAGMDYLLLMSRGTSPELRYFIFEESPAKYIVAGFKDALHFSVVEKEVQTVERKAAGSISGSLYLTLENLDLDPVLAVKMADVYAWTIDFYRIQEGDRFSVIYEEQVVEGRSMGIGKIKAAWFEQSGKGFYTFGFDRNGKLSYFDENGNSAKRPFLKAPLKFSRMTSGYSRRRFHPVNKVYKPHLGTDYAAPKGTPILAMGDGIVEEAGRRGGNGNFVKIKHNKTYQTQYLHMSGFAKGIRRGARVSQGEVIGYVGSTGLATGPHVCLRFWKNGKQVDHRKEHLVATEPLEKQFRPAFQEVTYLFKPQLDSLSKTTKPKPIR